ncbi:MAG: lactate utilization protein [Bacillota bacterium]
MLEKVERVLKALKRNNFEACYVETEKEALAEVLRRIPPETPVGVGGSLTINQLGIVEALSERGNPVYNHSGAANPAEMEEIRRQANNCDLYLTGINALTEDGQLVNVDGRGNRVAALAYGPAKVIAVCGTNKIVKDYNEAIDRIKNVAAPANAKRLNYDTPCVKTGRCEDCSSKQRICNIILVLQKQPFKKEIAVILVGRELGF